MYYTLRVSNVEQVNSVNMSISILISADLILEEFAQICDQRLFQ